MFVGVQLIGHPVALEAAVLGTQAVIRDLGLLDESNCFGPLACLRDQNIHLVRLGDNLLSCMIVPLHENILHMAQRHTSGRTTFQGAGQLAFSHV